MKGHHYFFNFLQAATPKTPANTTSIPNWKQWMLEPQKKQLACCGWNYFITTVYVDFGSTQKHGDVKLWHTEHEYCCLAVQRSKTKLKLNGNSYHFHWEKWAWSMFMSVLGKTKSLEFLSDVRQSFKTNSLTRRSLSMGCLQLCHTALWNDFQKLLIIRDAKWLL